MKDPTPEEMDTMLRHLDTRRRRGWRAKLDPVEWWNWLQGKRMDRLIGTSSGPPTVSASAEERVRVGTEMMVKGRGLRRRKDG